MTSEDSIRKFLSTVRENARRQMVEKRIMASGRSSASMHIESEQKQDKAQGQLRGLAYIQQEITGRRPGRFPPINNILQWIDEKRIQLVNITKRSLAFLIARKIARRGTDIFLGKRRGLDMRGIIAAAEPEFRRDLIEGSKAKYKTSLMGAFKDAQAALVRQ